MFLQSRSSTASATHTKYSFAVKTVSLLQILVSTKKHGSLAPIPELLCKYRTAGSPDAELSVQLEESLMQALQQIEATIDSVVTVLSNSIPGFAIASSSAADPQVSKCFASLGSHYTQNSRCCQASVLLAQSTPITLKALHTSAEGC